MRAITVQSAAACVFIAMLTGCSVPSPERIVYSADYISYESAEELIEDASAIIVGVVESSEVRKVNIELDPRSSDPELNPQAGADDVLEDATLVYTVHSVRVTDVIKGDAGRGDLIEVKQLGGDLDSQRYSEEGSTFLKQAGTYALYLQTFDGIPASLLNPTQATYEATADGGFQSVSADNPIAADVTRLLSGRGR